MGRARRPPSRLQDMVPSSLTGLPSHLPRLPEHAEAMPPPPPPSSVAFNIYEDPPELPRASPPPSGIPNPADDERASAGSQPVALDHPAPSTRPSGTGYDTPTNAFGVFRRYRHKPQAEPNRGLPPENIAAAPAHLQDRTPRGIAHAVRPWGATVATWWDRVKANTANARGACAPFFSYSAFKLMWWQHTGSKLKSDAELDRLVHEVLDDDRFSKEELKGFRAARAKQHLNEYSESSGEEFSPRGDGWRSSSVTLALPKSGVAHESDKAIPKFVVRGIWTRSIVDVVVSACREKSARDMFWFPYELLRSREPTPDCPNPRAQRLYTDFPNAAAMMREHEALQASPRHPDDPPEVEYVILPLQAYSDSTHLTQFGNTSLWPIYLWILTVCKYVRATPSALAAHHLAYMPSVSTGRLRYRMQALTYV